MLFPLDKLADCIRIGQRYSAGRPELLLKVFGGFSGHVLKMIYAFRLGEVAVYGHVSGKLIPEGFHVHVVGVAPARKRVIGREDHQAPDVPATDLAIGTVSWGKNNFRFECLCSIGQRGVGAAREVQLQMTVELLCSLSVGVAESEGVDAGPDGILMDHRPRQRQGRIQEGVIRNESQVLLVAERVLGGVDAGL